MISPGPGPYQVGSPRKNGIQIDGAAPCYDNNKKKRENGNEATGDRLDTVDKKVVVVTAIFMLV